MKSKTALFILLVSLIATSAYATNSNGLTISDLVDRIAITPVSKFQKTTFSKNQVSVTFVTPEGTSYAIDVTFEKGVGGKKIASVLMKFGNGGSVIDFKGDRIVDVGVNGKQLVYRAKDVDSAGIGDGESALAMQTEYDKGLAALDELMHIPIDPD